MMGLRFWPFVGRSRDRLRHVTVRLVVVHLL